MRYPTICQTQRGQRQRGSVYILVLGASLIVATIGISSLMAARVKLRTAASTSGTVEARELARTAIDRGMWEMKNNPAGWRAVFVSPALTSVSFGSGEFTLMAVDPVDGNLLDGMDDPVMLVGVGKSGVARYILAVMCNSDGTVQAGTWRRLVDSGL
tara:strand:- start:36 stop:506 length:471 start_codon:yes stop_codon:yes gene_type:complete